MNTLRLRQNGCHFADNIFNCIFLNENLSIVIKISLKFVPKGPINNILSLVQIMACRQQGDKPLSEPMVVSLLMDICGIQPQWVKPLLLPYAYFVILTHFPVVLRIFVIKLGHHRFSQWLLASSTSSHYHNQWWHLINYTPMNRLQWKKYWN